MMPSTFAKRKKNSEKKVLTSHPAPRGAKNEQAFSGVILKSERPSGPLFTRSGPPFFTFEHKIEALSTLMPSFPHSGPHVLTFCH